MNSPSLVKLRAWLDEQSTLLSSVRLVIFRCASKASPARAINCSSPVESTAHTPVLLADVIWPGFGRPAAGVTSFAMKIGPPGPSGSARDGKLAHFAPVGTPGG